MKFRPTDHANTDSYEARLYAAGSSTTVLDTLDLGKPTPDAFGKITVDISEWLEEQAAGDYEVKVAAINDDGEAEGTDSNAFSVPLVEE